MKLEQDQRDKREQESIESLRKLDVTKQSLEECKLRQEQLESEVKANQVKNNNCSLLSRPLFTG